MNNIKVFINSNPVEGAWGGGNNFTTAFHKHSNEFGASVISNPAQADVILITSLDGHNTGISALDAINLKFYKGVKTVFRVNDNDARKATKGVDLAVESIASMSNGTVFVSNWLKEYFQEKFFTSSGQKKLLKSSVIINGVDKDIFFDTKVECSTSDVRIMSHHWSDNRMKGADVYEFIDKFCSAHDDFYFNYIGRHKCKFIGDRTFVTPPQHGKLLGRRLSKLSTFKCVYISGTQFDPGPNHCIESISSGLETYVHSNGGGAVEFAGDDHTFTTFEDLEKILWSVRKNGTINPNRFQPTTWEECIKQYVDYIHEIV